MNARNICSQAIVVVGLVAMLLGAFDPLEGSLLILPGSGLVWLGALLGKNPQRRLLGVAFLLLAVGVAALFGLSAVGGVGGRSGRSMWWLLTVVPYPVGWLMGLGGVLALVGRGWHRRLLCGGVLLSVMALGTLILLGTLRLRGVVAEMPSAAFWLLVILPHGLGLIAALTGGVFWTIGSFRAPAQ
jgi:hypothetical protein